MHELEFVTRLDARQGRELCAMFQQEWWCKGRTPVQVERLLQGPSLPFAFVTPEGGLAAFARVMSDGIFKAWVFDVIVAPERRGRGFGAALVRRLLADPRLAHVNHVELYCTPERAPFYERLGFAEPAGIRLMRRTGGDEA